MHRLSGRAIDPSGSSSTGYSYKIPTNIGFMQALYEGHAYYYVDRKDPNATKRISLHYVHDTASIITTSYSVSIGPGQISLNNLDDNLRVMSGNFAFTADEF